MGSYEGKEKNIMETFLSVCQKIRIGVHLPKKLNQQCCSQLFYSKGYHKAYEYKANEVIEELWLSSGHGLWPVVIDVSSCAFTLKNLYPVLSLKNKKKYETLIIWDTVEFLYHLVLPKINVIQKKGSVVLHPVCSLEKMNISWMLEQIAKQCSSEVTVPLNSGCCGMAGDRGFLFPELTQSATHAEAAEVTIQKFEAFYSTTKTCELAMSEATSSKYESILYLVDESI
jgi:D-lactate dehydrogenase